MTLMQGRRRTITPEHAAERKLLQTSEKWEGTFLAFNLLHRMYRKSQWTGLIGGVGYPLAGHPDPCV